MKRLTKILSAGIILAAVLLLLLPLTFFLCRRRRRSRPRVSTSTAPKLFTDPSAASRAEKLEAGISKFHLSPIRSDSKNSLRFHQLHNLHILDHHHHHLQSFNWDDHPRLITEAVENGWLRFAFHGRPSSSLPPPRSAQVRWGLCVVCDGEKQQRSSSEINWEIPPGSSEFMQTVKLNLAGDDEDSSSSCSIVKMSLPLPGPSLATASFPQEAYFEISILHLGGILQPRFHRNSKRSKVGGGGGSIEGDRMKLIQENSSEGDLESGRKNGVLELNSDCGNGVVSLGLSIGGGTASDGTKMMKPGSYSGSIAFHSDGSVYLDGTKLMFESEAAQWNGVNKVIGLGYNPSKKMVFLTIDSELVRVIHCNSDIYKHPLYPVISANNTQVMVLINLGQSAFKYAPANARRTPNPCFIRSSPPDVTTVSNIAGNYEDSRELFSVGRLMESDWYDIMMKSKNKGSAKNSVGNGDESTADAESDLFEISLQS